VTELLKPAKRSPKSKARIPRVRAGGKRKKVHRREQRKAKMKDADKLFSEMIRQRDGWACRNCGSIKHPQCAHIVSRRYRATRWSMDNAVCLCRSCHLKYTYDPLGWEAWVEERFPVGRLDELKMRALAGVAHVDYDEMCVSLRKGLTSPRGSITL